jgi:hypothetical protein
MMHDGPEYPGNQHAKLAFGTGKARQVANPGHHGREPPWSVESTYLDNQNLSIRSNQRRWCWIARAAEVAAHRWLHSAAPSRLIGSGDVDACLALKSKIKGR